MKPSIIIMFVAWISVFTLTWLLVLRFTPLDGISIGSWIFFFIVSLFASMTQLQKKPEPFVKQVKKVIKGPE